MNKAELIDALAGKLGDKRTASQAVEALVEVVTGAVAKGEKVAITGFGVFERVERAARTARNPATGAIVKLKKTAVPKFRAGSQFKDYVSGAKKLAKSATSGGSAAKATKGAARPASKATAKAAVKKAPAKKAPAKKAAAKKAPARKAAKR